MAEQDDEQELAGLTVRRCEHCGGSIPNRRKDARFCSTSHRVMAHRKAKHKREIHDSLVTRGLTDQSLAELHERARPRLLQVDEDLVEPAEVVPDEFGYTDGLLDDEPNAAWTMRQQMEQETNAIRARYAPEIERWTKVYARNPGPAPRLTEINRKMRAEVEAIERAYYQAEAYELAAADQASGRAQVRAQERHKELVNLEGFGRDLRGGRYEPVEVSKATSDVFQFGQPGDVFGTDTELFSKSGIARKVYNSNPYTADGFVY